MSDGRLIIPYRLVHFWRRVSCTTVFERNLM